MSKRRYGKLVRNRVPELIRADGEIPNSRAMSSDEYRNELLYKLIEEAEDARKMGEYNDGDAVELTEEIADVLEVLYAIFKEFELDEGEIERVRRAKLERKGDFSERIFLESVIENN